LLQEPAPSVAVALAILANAQKRFGSEYDAVTDALMNTGLPVAVCTIYDTPPSGPDQAIIKAALCLFNDSITRAAFSRGAGLIDLRLVCTEDGDYANAIEPSSRGGLKIARAIAAFAAADHGTRPPIVVTGGLPQ